MYMLKDSSSPNVKCLPASLVMFNPLDYLIKARAVLSDIRTYETLKMDCINNYNMKKGKDCYQPVTASQTLHREGFYAFPKIHI